MRVHGRDDYVPVPDFRLGPGAASIQRIAGLVGVVGLLLCIVGLFVSRQQFFQSYLFAFLYWGGFTLGGLGIIVLNNTVGGGWGVTSRRFLEAAMRTLPFLV
ncbi:MAG: hypothetical protein JOZ62_17030, partial [Acidobacteriaceae bacterium]|nr:hypothetical protein [Acidobacteriaceae bacterium]